MHWGIRRFQNYDGTRTAAGRRRERLGITGPTNSGSSNSGTEYYEPNYTWRFVKNAKKGPSVKDFWSTNSSNEENAKEGQKTKEFWSKKESNADSDKKVENAKEEQKPSEEEIKVKKTAGKDAVKNMSNKEFNRYVSKMNDAELKAFYQRLSTESQVRKNVETADDVKKKQFENAQASLGDAKSIANDASNLARNMKNLTSNKSTKSYIDPKKLGKMSDDEIRAATNRAIIENNYLTATNQTMQKGKNSIDWDKIATIAGIAATTISIAGSVNAIRNRRND